MKIADIITVLRGMEIDQKNPHVLMFKIITQEESFQKHMISQTRKNSRGGSVIMSKREFKEYCERDNLTTKHSEG